MTERKNEGILSIYHPEIPSFLSDVLQAKSLQRISKVGMHCGMEYTFFPFYRNLKRYDRLFHSLGVALIVYHFTGKENEVYAGLFHDIATPCFAHVIDFLNHDYTKQESTEEKTAFLLLHDEKIRKELETRGIRYEEVNDYHRYPIADNDSPFLSADRLEYTLSNFLNFSLCSLDEVKDFYDNLRVSRNEKGEEELCFQSIDKAERFTLLTLKNSHYYVSDEDRYAMELLARILKNCIQRNVIKESDLYTTEENVINLLGHDSRAFHDFTLFHSLSAIKTSPTRINGFFQVPSKKRYIDPYVMGQGRVSSLSEKAKTAIQAFRSLSFEAYLSSDIQPLLSFEVQ